MDASTLLYLSKIANFAQNAAAAASNSNTSSNGQILGSVNPGLNISPIYDPAMLNSMAESYLRRFCSTDPTGFSSFMTNINNNNNNNNSTASSPSSSSSSSLSNSLVSPASSPNTRTKSNNNSSSSSSSHASSSSSSSSSKKISSNSSNSETANAAAAATMLALKTLSSQFGTFTPGLIGAPSNSQTSANNSSNGSKFSIADILGIGSPSAISTSNSKTNTSIISPSSSMSSSSVSPSVFKSDSMTKKRLHNSTRNNINNTNYPINPSMISKSVINNVNNNSRLVSGQNFQHQSRLGQFQNFDTEENFSFQSNRQIGKYNHEKMNEMNSEFDTNNTEQEYDTDEDDDDDDDGMFLSCMLKSSLFQN